MHASTALVETYKIDRWPDDLVKVPRDAWERNEDGSSTQTVLFRARSGARRDTALTPSALRKVLASFDERT